MKTKIFTRFVGGFAVSLLAFASCSKDYLNTSPTDAVDEKAAVSNFKTALSSLNGISQMMYVQHGNTAKKGSFAGEYSLHKVYENYQSPNFHYNEYAGGWAVVHNMNLLMNDNTRLNFNAWYYYYTLINSANSIISGISGMVKETKAEEKAFIEASALTFRAYSYQRLLNYYAKRWVDSDGGKDACLVLRIDTSMGDSPLVAQSEIYKQIYADCDRAIKLFTESGIQRTDYWLPNVNVAHAVYARAALTKQDYAKALEQAKKAREGYKLMTNEEYLGGFYKANSEWIFGCVGSEEENLWYWAPGTQFACNGHYAGKTTNGAGSISISFAAKFPNNDVRKALFLTPDKFPHYNKDYVGANDTFYYLGFENENDEIKIKNQELYDEVKAYIKEKRTIKGLPAPLSSGFYHLGDQLKFYVKAMPGVASLPFIRSSEMVLIEAEANYFLNDIPAAQASLNLLNKDTGRDASYNCTKTGDALFEEIRNYRGLELWGEGFDFSDYKRWKLPIVRKTLKDGGNAHVATAITIEPDGKGTNGWVYVTPQPETDQNPLAKK